VTRRFVLRDGFLAVLALFVLLALVIPSDHDEGQYVAAAHFVAEGLRPYRDLPYLQTPLQPFLAAPIAALTVGYNFISLRIATAIAAMAALPKELHWRWVHVGGGPIIAALKDQANAAGIGERIDLRGVQTQAEVIDLYRSSDLFVLPSREGADGDRDGLPNVLMEAQSQALACLSTRFSAIPELIIDGETGVLVPPGDAPSLTAALDRLIGNPADRDRLGMAGFRRVREHFEADAGIRQLAALLGQSAANATDR
jgi:glycosyltransferase involved in cell wall biosynthesis